MNLDIGDDDDEEPPRCPYGKDRFAHCFRCHSQNEDIYWDSCANRENRKALSEAMDNDD